MEGVRKPERKILHDLTVVDLSRYLSGPLTTLFLAALGATVIRIDDPRTGNPTASAPPFFGPQGVSLHRATPRDVGLAYLKRCRGKNAITLDLKSTEGRALFYRLIAKADVLVENFRPATAHRLGVQFETLRHYNSRLIHCSITGYGSTGPECERKAVDLMVQAATGLMSITGAPAGEPSKAASPLSDGIAGTFAMAGILAALLQRAQTGEGQFIDVSMADCLISLIFDEPFDCYEKLGLPFRQGNRMMRLSPFNTFGTSDGAVVIGALTEADWAALLETMDRKDLLTSKDFMDLGWRIAHNAEVDRVVSAWTTGRTQQDVLAELMRRNIPCSPVRNIRDIPSWQQLLARHALEPVAREDPSASSPLAPTFPLKFSAADTTYERPAPLVGEHNEDIYCGLLGLAPAELQSLKERGVV